MVVVVVEEEEEEEADTGAAPPAIAVRVGIGEGGTPKRLSGYAIGRLEGETMADPLMGRDRWSTGSTSARGGGGGDSNVDCVDNELLFRRWRVGTLASLYGVLSSLCCRC